MKVNPHAYPSFFKTYLGEARHRERIHIPPEFVKAHKNKLDQCFWVVKAEAGASWDMKIERRGTERFFSKADWENFAKHHDLRFGDILLFFLVGKSEFEVMLFSQTTSCRILSLQPERADTDASSDDQKIEASRNAKKRKRRLFGPTYETPKKSKRSGDDSIVKEEKMSETESEKVEGVQIMRYSTVNLKARYPYFETVVKKSHQTFMCVPMEFARQTEIIHEKNIELSGENGKTEKVQIEVLGPRVHMVDGWKTFKKSNKIMSGDRCLFTLVNPDRRKETKRLFVKKLRN